jgi:ABC-type amino acid transport substrate-binding protein
MAVPSIRIARSLPRAAALLAGAAATVLVAVGCGDSSDSGSSGGTKGVGKTNKDVKFERPATNGPVPASVKAACDSSNSPTIKKIQQRGKLNWALGIAPPFGFKDDKGRYQGVEVDNANELAHYLGVKASIHDYDYNLLPATVNGGQADIIGAELFKTPERAKAIAFSNFYFYAGQLFYVLKKSKWQTVDDLNSKDDKWYQEIGSGQVELAKKLIPKAPRTLVPKRGQVLVAYDFMRQGVADSTALEAHYWPVLSRVYPDLVAIGKNGRITKTTGFEQDEFEGFDIGFGLKRGDPGWLKCVNAFVDNAKQTKTMPKRITYWSAVLGESLKK